MGKLPAKEFGLACSGGVDSMAVLNFLVSGGRRPHVLYFNHNTEHGHEAETFVREYCKSNGLDLTVGYTDVIPTKNQEKVWSDLRYGFFSEFDFPVVACHHLDDCVETYLFSCMRGFQSVIPYRKGNVIRPFLLTEKSAFDNWCARKNVPFIQDESNFSNDHARNLIRNEIVPHALVINPGLKNMVKKMVLGNFLNGTSV